MSNLGLNEWAMNDRAGFAMNWRTVMGRWLECDSTKEIMPISEWQPTEDIRQAWMLVVAAEDKGYAISVESVVPSSDVPVYRVTMSGRGGSFMSDWEGDIALAITEACVPALEAQDD